MERFFCIFSICVSSSSLFHTSAQDLDTGVMHLLPAMEAATLAHRTNAARTHVVHIMEKHLVPAMAPTQAECHEGVQHRPCAIRVGSKEVVPEVGMVEIRDE